MPEPKWVELFRFSSTCRHISTLHLFECPIGTAGRHLAQSIRSWGDDPPLETLNLHRCKIPEDSWPDILKSLATCKHMKVLNLDDNYIAAAGRHLAQSIRSWGDDRPLETLNLSSCSIPKEAWSDILKSLAACKHMKVLDLQHSYMGVAGHTLAESIRSWGDDQQLEELYLWDCSIPEEAWSNILKSLATCKHIEVLDLRGNHIGAAGHDLAESIRSWGDDPPLEILALFNCSIPEEAWPDILKFLATCKHMKVLDLQHSYIGAAGHTLAESIRSWGDDPPLETLYLRYCSILEEAWSDILKSLATCKQMKVLDLSLSDIGAAGHHLAQSIRSWGDDPPLETLYLRYCSILEEAWFDILKSLGTCKYMKLLDLQHSYIGAAEHHLAESIRSWGDDPPLEALNLRWCSIPEEAWSDILKSLATCKHMKVLLLGNNHIGAAGHQLAKSLRSWGNDPPLETLNLQECSIPEEAWPDILKCLATCKYMKVLDLSHSHIGAAGHQLAKSLRSWGNDPRLKTLNLWNCSIPEKAWPDILKFLATCKHMKLLDLQHNYIGAAGHHLAQSIRSWGDDPPLEALNLRWCSMSEEAWPDILKSLGTCKYMKVLDLQHSHIGAAGHTLAESIRSWGNDPPLETLYLRGRSITEEAWPFMLSSLSVCRHLFRLDLSENDLRGSLLSFLPEGCPGLPELETFDVRDCGLNRHDIVHLTSIIQRDKLPGLRHLELGRVDVLEEELEELKGICKRKAVSLLEYPGKADMSGYTASNKEFTRHTKTVNIVIYDINRS